MPTILDGKTLADTIKQKIAESVKELPEAPHLAVVLVGDDPASQIYVRNKQRDCEECGFKSTEYRLDTSVSQSELFELVKGLSKDPSVNGILVQLPLSAWCSSLCRHTLIQKAFLWLLLHTKMWIALAPSILVVWSKAAKDLCFFHVLPKEY